MDTLLLIFLLTICSFLGGVLGGFLFTLEFKRWLRALEDEIGDVADTVTREVKKRAAFKSVAARRTLTDEMAALEDHVQEGDSRSSLLGASDDQQAEFGVPVAGSGRGGDPWSPAWRASRSGNRGPVRVGPGVANGLKPGGSGGVASLLPWPWALSRSRRGDGPELGSPAIQDHRT